MTRNSKYNDPRYNAGPPAIYGASSYDPVTDIVTITPPGGLQPHTTSRSKISGWVRNGSWWGLFHYFQLLRNTEWRSIVTKSFDETFKGDPMIHPDMKAILYEDTVLYCREQGEYLSKRQIDEFNATSPSKNRTNLCLVDENVGI